ncbi:isoflavone reductase [Astrocystis sublimbata]|nr:isoflavone reductase [Astrocystis sublimbata]
MGKKSDVAMMRIAIAGAGGFASLLVQVLSETAHPILVLSTRTHPELEANYDCQIAVVDYHDLETLQFTLQGVDLVISTIAGPEQLNLIDAARKARVHTFVPSEFEGSLGHRPASDPFDNGSSTALGQLRHWFSSRHYQMNYTVFSCGIFYERFAPGGLRAYNMGGALRFPNQGDYLVDVEYGTAEIPAADAQGRQIKISMTAAYDVARFVAEAVDLGLDRWPREFKMRGARLTPQKIIEYCTEVRQIQFSVVSRPYSEIVAWLDHFYQNNENDKWYAMQQVLQTADGRYSFGDPNLNDLVNVEPTGFRQWLYSVWGPAQ